MRKTWIVPAVLLAFVIGVAFVKHALDGPDDPPPPPPDESAAVDASDPTEPGDSEPPDNPIVPPEQPIERTDAEPEAQLGEPTIPVEMTSGKTTLFSRRKYSDYERATMSFEHGVRDDPNRRITLNDWNVEYGNGPGDWLSVLMVTDDRSVIVDLGKQELGDVRRLPKFPQFERHVTTKTNAIEGHVFAVHTVDGNSNAYSLFRVDKLVAGDQIEISWICWQPGREAPAQVNSVQNIAPTSPLDLSGTAIRNLSGAFRTARRHLVQDGERRLGTLADDATITLQLRTGAQGGNPSVVRLGAPTKWTNTQVTSGAPLDMSVAPQTSDDAQGFARGGMIPRGRALVVTSFDVFASAGGDMNGPGFAEVQIKDDVLFSVQNKAGPFQIYHVGQAVLFPGDESKLSIAAKNSSRVAIIVKGKLVSEAEAKKLTETPFTPANPPAKSDARSRPR